MSGAVLRARGVAAGYRRGRRKTVTVLRDVDLDLHAGSLVCLLGPNGAGKSTLLRTLVGAQRALAGTVLLGEHDIRELDARGRARRLSVVLTDRIDVGYLSGRELVELGRSPRIGWLGSLGDRDHEVVDWALEAAGARALAPCQVHELSDGERQRLMIARALAQEPDVLVLDEPTAFLDLTARLELMALLRRLTTSTALAVLMSTHELELALRNADEAWLVHPDRGFVRGAPEDLAFSGDIERTYAGGSVRFDVAAGTLVVHGRGDAPVVVVRGDRDAVRWASRAVARAGWHPVEASHEAGVFLDVRTVDGAIHWLLDGPDLAQGVSCADLVRQLRGTATGPAPSRTRTTTG